MRCPIVGQTGLRDEICGCCACSCASTVCVVTHLKIKFQFPCRTDPTPSLVPTGRVWGFRGGGRSSSTRFLLPHPLFYRRRKSSVDRGRNRGCPLFVYCISLRLYEVSQGVPERKSWGLCPETTCINVSVRYFTVNSPRGGSLPRSPLLSHPPGSNPQS